MMAAIAAAERKSIRSDLRTYGNLRKEKSFLQEMEDVIIRIKCRASNTTEAMTLPLYCRHSNCLDVSRRSVFSKYRDRTKGKRTAMSIQEACRRLPCGKHFC